jgi:type IV pilus assembly protein PilE
MKKNLNGFTLIELMLVVVIIGVLAAVAYPSYVEQVRKGRRSECKSAILQTSNLLERFYTINNSYSSDFAAIGGKNFSGDNADSSSCTISIEAEGATFTVTATPKISDPNCGNLTLNNTGLKTESGSKSVDYCW